MMKKIILLSIVIGLVFLAGCVERTVKIGCCAAANISDGCMLLNMTTSELEDYISDTHWCNETMGHCNVTIGGKDYLVPVCTDAELNECINPECTAMICGDFMFKPRIAPGVVDTSSEGSPGASVDVPPEEEGEEARLAFYKAQCKFMKMDNKLASLMKNTNSEINVFRFGVGQNFDEFERYQYLFPMSDRYCNVNPEIYGFTTDRVDRYMNYLGVSGTSTHVPFNPETLPECIDDSSTGEVWVPFRYGLQDYEYHFDCSIDSEQTDRSEYSYELFCPHIYQIEYGTHLDFPPSTRLDRAFYRKGLSIAHAETIYDETTSRAPFECLFDTSCYSGTCDSSFYSRSANVVSGGSEVTTDCYVAEDSYDQSVVVCASTTDVDVDPAAEDPPDFDYASVPVNIAKIRIRVDSYPGSGFSVDTESDSYGIDDCGTEEGDNVCELVQQWRDFSGLDLGEEVDGESNGYLDYELGEQVVSDEFELEYLPLDFGIQDSDDCELLGGADTSECPYITGEDSYPPAGGIVFFGHDSTNPIIWNDGGVDYEIIGYAIAPHSPDFYDYMFIDRCSKEYAFEMPETVGEGADSFICSASCMDRCAESGIEHGVLFDQCHNYCYDIGAFPCNVTGTITEGLPFTEDLIPVEVGEPDGANWQKLMDAFEPLYMERIERLQRLNWEDGCGKRMDAPDLILSTIPWILEFKKKDGDKEFTSSEAANVIYNYNIYNEHATSRSTDICSIRYGKRHHDSDRYNYWLLYASEIWLIKKPLDNALGTCEVDVNGFPKTNTYGWCEPCTGSTIAYQEVNAMDPYVPQSEVRVPHEYSGMGSGTSEIEICSRDGDEITCDAWWITDVEELNGDVEETGSPRTVPLATILKERIGNYLKSGILPVLDMSGVSNWEKFDYTEYAFQDVYGDMGAVVTIVDTIDMSTGDVSTLSSSTVRDTIAERTAVIKTACPRCMPSIQIINIPDNETLDELLSALFSDNRLRLDIEIVSFWYRPIGFEYEERYEGDSDDELADSTVDDMLSFSNTILSYGKPSIITRFSIIETADTWTEENSDVLFDKLADRSGEFANTGTIGIIYAPVRTTYSYETTGALVDATGTQGLKGEKFCNLQMAINRYLTPPPTTIFSPIAAFENVSCINCTAIDYLTGTCTAECANGEECLMPEGVTSGMRCPPGVIVEPCRPCNDTVDTGTYRCEYTYSDRTTEVLEFDSSLISSDAYMDVIGGLEEPGKCCISDDTGQRYSYSKQELSSVRNIPVVFPKTGNTNIDCGAIGFSGNMFSSSFCGIEVVPMRDYEVTCEFIPD